MTTIWQSWWIFIKERFPLPSHLPMVGLFSLGNTALAQKLAGAAQGDFSNFPFIFVLTLLFFFRLRCFDEIKDYEVDLKVNPTRPLARGILTIVQVKRMIAILCAIEIMLASRQGRGALQVHSAAMIYSFLMYREFFLGKYLRPHLTTYAVTHTLVSMLLGWSIAAQTTNLSDFATLKAVLWLGPINWALFNLFEFARKTFAPDEERSDVESYSSLFGPLGAVLLSLSQVIIALGGLWCLSLDGFAIQAVTALLPLAAGGYFIIRPAKASASLYRGITGAYLLLFYGVLTYQSLAL